MVGRDTDAAISPMLRTKACREGRCSLVFSARRWYIQSIKFLAVARKRRRNDVSLVCSFCPVNEAILPPPPSVAGKPAQAGCSPGGKRMRRESSSTVVSLNVLAQRMLAARQRDPCQQESLFDSVWLWLIAHWCKHARAKRDGKERLNVY